MPVNTRTRTRIRKTLTATLILTGPALFPTQTQAYPVEVISSAPVRTLIVPQLTMANTTLEGIGGAITGGTDKIAAMIQESALNQQQYASYLQQTRNLEQARQSYTVPDSICTASAAGQATQVVSTAAAKQGGLSSGRSVTDSAIRKAVSDPTPPPAQAQFTAADIHGGYCTQADSDAYGSTVCRSTTLPGGDTDIRSVLSGAGEEDKAPDLTFTQEQADAARMYMQNSTQLAVSKKLTKGEVKTESGKQYVGMMAQYDAQQSAAGHPQLAMIADSLPNEATTAVLQETFSAQSGVATSAKSYFDDNASPEAKRTGTMSRREFDAFEVGRRYASTDYLTDLYAMQGDNLIRESVQVQNLQNWLLLGIRQQLQEQAILQGQQLSLQSANYYGPQLQQKLQQVTAGTVR